MTSFPWFVYFIAGFFGALWGSFSTVLVERLPRGMGVITGRSKCPNCKNTIKWYHNIPILSYLILRGKCAYCGWRIPVRYIVIELSSVIVSLLAVAFARNYNELLLFYFPSLVIVPIFYMDLFYQIIHDALNYMIICYAFLAVLLGFAKINIFQSFLGMGTCAGVTLLIYFASRGGFGDGDVMLATAFGSILGWKLGLFCLSLSFIIGGLFGILIMLKRKLAKEKIKGTMVPFGPFMCIAFLITLYRGEEVLNWWLRSWQL